MIPDIGLIIGAYVITRCLSLIFQEEQSMVVMIFASLTIIITIISLISLIYKGSLVQ